MRALTAALALASGIGFSFIKTIRADSKPAPDVSETSEIRCRTKSFATARSISKDAFVDIGVQLGTAFCGGNGAVGVGVVVEDVAYAIAEAAVYTSIQCEASGGGFVVIGDVMARAEANATANAVAVADGWSSVADCKGCTAAAGVFVAASEKAFVSAVAESQSQVAVILPERLKDSIVDIRAYIDVVAKKIIPVFVGVLVESNANLISNYSGDNTSTTDTTVESCSASALGCAIVGDEVACCAATAESIAETVEKDVWLEAVVSVELTNDLCKEDAAGAIGVGAAVGVTDIARALIKSISRVVATCFASENGFGCAFGQTQIKAAARAEAYAFAQAFVEVKNCACEASLEAIAAAYEEVFIKAITAAQAGVCVSGGFVAAEVVVKQIVEAEIEAWASAAAVAYTAIDSECGGCATVNLELEAPGPDSGATCQACVSLAAEEEAKSVLVELEAEAAVSACKNGQSAAKASLVAQAAARVFARVMGRISTSCETSGTAGGCAFAEGAIRAVAKATATAFASAWVSINAYDDCPCEVEVYVNSTAVETVLVEAAVDFKQTVCAANGGSVSVDTIFDFFVERHFTAFAEAVAQATTEVWNESPETCMAIGTACSVVGGGTKACCDVEVDAASTTFAKNAKALLAAEALVDICDPGTEVAARSSLTVEATAKAWIEFVIAINAECAAAGDASVCTALTASISDYATAWAKVTLEAWAGALFGCGCDIEADDAATILRDVFISGTLEVFGEFCLDGSKHVEFDKTIIFGAYVESSVTAIGRALAAVKATVSDAGDAECQVTAIAGPGTA